MKNSLKIISILMLCLLMSCKKNTLLVDLDGNSYKTKKYGKTIWMIENLKVKQDNVGNSIKYFIPNNDSINIPNFGLLYDYEIACKVCPKGWRIPTNEDWKELFKLNNIASNYKDRKYWGNDKNSNVSLFSVRPSGYGNNGAHFNKFNSSAILWSKTKENKHFIWTYIIEKGNDSIRKASQHPTYAFSIRCVKSLP